MSTTSTTAATAPQATLLDRFRSVRDFTKTICEPLEVEDCVIQSMPDVSPTRWHLAHTTWFFETFVLKAHWPSYRPQHEAFEYLFNSYYNSVGRQFPRAQRGFLSRPTVAEVWSYRESVDQAMREMLSQLDDGELARTDSANLDLVSVVELGLQHEQQHQELMLTDIKHVLSCNPLFPSYKISPSELDSRSSQSDSANQPIQNTQWIDFAGGIHEVGHAGEAFCFDNELPRHQVLLGDYSLQDRLVTNAEYLEFIDDGGYETSSHWLSMGWNAVESSNWRAPLNWHWRKGAWFVFSMAGLTPIELSEPVCHVSYFEADAFARWAGKRLPTEFEWERAAAAQPIRGNLADTQRFHPSAASGSGLRQCFGDVWEWTSSQYSAYPGYQPPAGALGEYNGKFMCNQFVLRGGSCVTSQSHLRASYRNFFPPEARWQFSGIRLAK